VNLAMAEIVPCRPVTGGRSSWHPAVVTGGWLVSGGRVLASVEVVGSRGERRRGLLGRDDFDGALLLEPCRWVHTIGMRFPIDVAYLDAEGKVIKTVRMSSWRVGVPVGGARKVVEARAGAFDRWGLRVGDQVEVRDGT